MALNRLAVLAGIIGLASVGSAFAGNVTFAASGVFADNAALGGSLVIDTASGVVQQTNIDLTVIGGDAGTPGFVFDTLNFSEKFGPDVDGDNIWVMDFTDSTNTNPSLHPNLELEIDIGANTSLAGFTGTTTSGVDSFCIDSVGNCGAYYSSYQTTEDPFLNSGSLTAASAPEPGSVLLLVVPAVWMIRRSRRVA